MPIDLSRGWSYSLEENGARKPLGEPPYDPGLLFPDGPAHVRTLYLWRDITIEDARVLPDIGLFLDGISSVWTIRWNSRMIASAGAVRGDRVANQGTRREVFFRIPREAIATGKNTIAITISGHPEDGFTGFHFLPGSIDVYENFSDDPARQIKNVLIGLFFFFGLYQFLFFLKRPKEVFNLYFALFCVFLFAFFLLRSPLLHRFLNDWTVLARAQSVALFPLPFFLGMFLNLFFYNQTGRVPILAAIFCGSCSILAVSLPYRYLDEITFVWQITTMAGLVPYALFLTGRAAFEGKLAARRLLLVILIFFGTVVLDILRYTNVFDTGIDDLARYGFFVFTAGIALVLANRFVHLHNEIETLNIGLEQKVRERTFLLQNALNELDMELDMARSIQSGINLQSDRARSGIQLDALYLPLGKVSGDYFDVFESGEHTLFVMVDASGHGIPAALITMTAKQIFSEAIEKLALIDPVRIFCMVNHEIGARIKTSDYLTACLLRIDPENMIHFCSAGHPAPLLYRKNRHEIVELQSEGVILGCLGNVAPEHFIPGRTRIEPGDRIFLFTDGIIEQKNESSHEFGTDRLAAAILKRSDQSLADLNRNIVEEIRRFAGTAAMQDDITLLALEFSAAIPAYALQPD